MAILLMQSTIGADLQRLQRRRKQGLWMGVGACLLLMLFCESQWRQQIPTLDRFIEGFGLFLIVLCILGRTWCTLYIGGLKKRSLVTKGPYSVTRNPLYAFTVVGAAGMGAQSGSMVIAALFVAASFVIFSAVIRQEEVFLSASFPIEYANYAARVPRFFPRPSLWDDAEELLVKPRLVRQTFLDACVFLVALPLTEAIEWLHDLGWVPRLLWLP
jgi:protein-S-isoprenylcysteine O-methyltransferase Ste14